MLLQEGSSSTSDSQSSVVLIDASGVGSAASPSELGVSGIAGRLLSVTAILLPPSLNNSRGDQAGHYLLQIQWGARPVQGFFLSRQHSLSSCAHTLHFEAMMAPISAAPKAVPPSVDHVASSIGAHVVSQLQHCKSANVTALAQPADIEVEVGSTLYTELAVPRYADYHQRVRPLGLICELLVKCRRSRSRSASLAVFWRSIWPLTSPLERWMCSLPGRLAGSAASLSC